MVFDFLRCGLNTHIIRTVFCKPAESLNILQPSKIFALASALNSLQAFCMCEQEHDAILPSSYMSDLAKVCGHSHAVSSSFIQVLTNHVGIRV